MPTRKSDHPRLNCLVWSGILVAAAFLPGMPVAGAQPASGPAAGQAPPAQSEPDWLPKIRGAVVTIVVHMDRDAPPSSMGTAWFVGPDRVVTTRRVIACGSSAEVRLNTGATVPIKGVLADCCDDDLALLQLEPTEYPPEPLYLANEDPKDGDQVLVVCSPLGVEHRVVAGVLRSAGAAAPATRMLRIVGPLSLDSRGSPVFDARGQVVGIVTPCVLDGKYVYLLAKASEVERLKAGRPVDLLEWCCGDGSEKATHRWDWQDAYAAVQTENYVRAPEAFRGIIERAPDSREAFVMLAWAHGHLRQWQQAAEAYEQAICIDPYDADSRYGLANDYAYLGRSAEAVAAYQQVIRLKANYAEAYYGLAWAYGQLGRWEDALRAYAQYIQFKNNDAAGYFGLGYAHGKLGRPEKEIEAYKLAVSINPGYVQAHLGLGRAFWEMKRWPESIEAYQQASRVRPGYADAYQGLGCALREAGREKEAVEAFRQAVRLKPDDAGAHYGLGCALTSEGRSGEALEAYKQAVRLNPKFVEAYHGLGYAYDQLGRWPEAIAAYEEALRIDPQYTGVQCGLSHARAQANRWRVALLTSKFKQVPLSAPASESRPAPAPTQP